MIQTECNFLVELREKESTLLINAAGRFIRRQDTVLQETSTLLIKLFEKFVFPIHLFFVFPIDSLLFLLFLLFYI